jgi:hypothetical protein
MKLTEDRIKKLECPSGKKDILVFDEVQRGLAVRVSCTGSKLFCASTLSLARSAESHLATPR